MGTALTGDPRDVALRDALYGPRLRACNVHEASCRHQGVRHETPGGRLLRADVRDLVGRRPAGHWRIGRMSGTTPTSDPRFAYALMAMLAGPSVTGFLLTGLVHGRAGLRDFLSRLVTWRVGAVWYAVALLTAPVVMMVTLLVLSFTSSGVSSGHCHSDEKVPLLLISVAVGLVAPASSRNWGGRASRSRRCRRRDGVFATGLSWASGGARGTCSERLGEPRGSGELAVSVFLAATAIGFFVGYLTAFRVLMVWVYDRTGSLFVAMLMHASLTASLLILNPSALTGVALLGYSFALAVVVWAAVAAIAVTPEYRGVHRGSFVNAPVRPI